MRFVTFLVENGAVLGHVVENIAVMGLFIFFLNLGENRWAFLGSQWYVLLLFENAFNFFVLEFLNAIIIAFHDSFDSCLMQFGVVSMKLVIFVDFFIFLLKLFEIVDSSHELLLLISEVHFFVFDGVGSGLIVHDIVEVFEIGDILWL